MYRAVVRAWLDVELDRAFPRPEELLSDMVLDVQFRDLQEGYLFFLKVFEGAEGLADPVSSSYELVFRQ